MGGASNTKKKSGNRKTDDKKPVKKLSNLSDKRIIKFFGDDEEGKKRYYCVREYVLKKETDFDKIVKKLGLDKPKLARNAVDCWEKTKELKYLKSENYNIYKSSNSKKNTKKPSPKKESTSEVSEQLNLEPLYESTQALEKKLGAMEKNLNKVLSNVMKLAKEIHEEQDAFQRNHKILEELKKKCLTLNDEIEKRNNSVDSLISLFDQLPTTDRIENLHNDVFKRLGYIDERISTPISTNFPKELRSIGKSCETIEGKVRRIDDIHKLLDEKGISIREEFPPSNDDEETVVQLSKYCEKIVSHLTTAARHYARNRDDISREGRQKHEEEIEKARGESFNIGKEAGRIEVLEDLIEKFDMETLLRGDSEQVKTVFGFLRNHGLEEDGKIQEGKKIEIQEENRGELEPMAEFQGLGVFTVKASCYKLGDKIIRKAVLESEPAPVEEGEDQEPSPPMEERASKGKDKEDNDESKEKKKKNIQEKENGSEGKGSCET